MPPEVDKDQVIKDQVAKMHREARDNFEYEVGRKVALITELSAKLRRAKADLVAMEFVPPVIDID